MPDFMKSLEVFQLTRPVPSPEAKKVSLVRLSWLVVIGVLTSNGPAVRLFELRATASPIPLPLVVKMPGTRGAIVTAPRET